MGMGVSQLCIYPDVTLLCGAVMRGHIHTVGTLINAGVDVNETHFGYRSALEYAIMNGYQLVKILVNAGANVSVVMSSYRFEQAVRDMSYEVFCLLYNSLSNSLSTDSPVSNMAKINPRLMCCACMYSRVNIVEFLLRCGVDPNGGEISPIHVAAERGHTKVMSVLLAGGARPCDPKMYTGDIARILRNALKPKCKSKRCTVYSNCVPHYKF